jgi:hypothetical protein
MWNVALRKPMIQALLIAAVADALLTGRKGAINAMMFFAARAVLMAFHCSSTDKGLCAVRLISTFGAKACLRSTVAVSNLF